MAEELNTPDLTNETYDIFLCTRELPDALTPETAALRQLCAALIGSGYRVFFPPSTLFGQEPEAQAKAIAQAVKTAPVMIAAAVGDEGILDPTARFLWGKFRAMAGEDPSRTFLACCRQGVCFLPLAFLLPRLFGLAGVEMLQPAADLLTFVIAVPFLVRMFKKNL